MIDLLETMIVGARASAASLSRGEPRQPACTCTTGRSEEITVVETVPYGDKGRSFEVEVPVVRCLDCGASFTDQRAEVLRQKTFESL